MEVSTGRHKLNKFGVGVALIAVASVVLIWYTNPELITSWFKKPRLDGDVGWQAAPKTGVNVMNKGEAEWKDVKVTLNKSSVTQRYEFEVASIKKHRLPFFIPADRFQKSNGEGYDTTAGEPHTITVEASIPDDKGGTRRAQLEIKLGGKKI